VSIIIKKLLFMQLQYTEEEVILSLHLVIAYTRLIVGHDIPIMISLMYFSQRMHTQFICF